MQLTPYELALINGGFAVLGVLVGSLITYYFSLSLAQRNGRREAGQRLRAAFAPEISALHPISGEQNIDVEQFLSAAFPKHREAVVEFSYYLKPKKRESFMEAWRNYYEVGGSVRFFDYYLGDNPRQKFEENVNLVLSFTEKC